MAKETLFLFCQVFCHFFELSNECSSFQWLLVLMAALTGGKTLPPLRSWQKRQQNGSTGHCGHILASHIRLLPAYAENHSCTGTRWGQEQRPTENIPRSQDGPGLLFNPRQPAQHEQGEMSYQLETF